VPIRKRVFSYEETLEMFPQVRDLTARAVQEVQTLYDRVQSPQEMERRSEELEAAASSIIEAWASEVLALGCEVKGLWLVDWDCGDGYYCWHYPEESVGFFHGYEDGFRGRVPIA
jgi:hypothetical protein